ncbi:MAG: putative Zn-binding protein involved in type VI secretion, partial [Candidatus Azotimanducaceae bacterium]
MNLFKKYLLILLLIFPPLLLAEARLENLATRGFIGTGDNVLIGGLVISGDTAKTILIRARGPALTAAGVEGAISNTQILLFSGSNLIDSNDDWETHENANQVPTSLQPTDFRESVIVSTLNPGAYTAIITGINDEEGIGLVEIFELSNTGNTRLGNIATRGFVGTGDAVMIGGLVISGDENMTLLIRAKGPSL